MLLVILWPLNSLKRVTKSFRTLLFKNSRSFQEWWDFLLQLSSVPFWGYWLPWSLYAFKYFTWKCHHLCSLSFGENGNYLIFEYLYSTISSTLNSLAAVTWEDFLSKIGFFDRMGDFAQATTYKILSSSNKQLRLNSYIVILCSLLIVKFTFYSCFVWNYMRLAFLPCWKFWRNFPISYYSDWNCCWSSRVSISYGSLLSVRKQAC